MPVDRDISEIAGEKLGLVEGQREIFAAMLGSFLKALVNGNRVEAQSECEC